MAESICPVPSPISFLSDGSGVSVSSICIYFKDGIPGIWQAGVYSSAQRFPTRWEFSAGLTGCHNRCQRTYVEYRPKIAKASDWFRTCVVHTLPIPRLAGCSYEGARPELFCRRVGPRFRLSHGDYRCPVDLACLHISEDDET
jgi:hypothetical protein